MKWRDMAGTLLFVQPSRWDLCRRRRIPGVETPGYCRVVPLGRTQADLSRLSPSSKKFTHYLLFVSRFVNPPHPKPPVYIWRQARRLSCCIGPAQTQCARLPGKAVSGEGRARHSVRSVVMNQKVLVGKRRRTEDYPPCLRQFVHLNMNCPTAR